MRRHGALPGAADRSSFGFDAMQAQLLAFAESYGDTGRESTGAARCDDCAALRALATKQDQVRYERRGDVHHVTSY